MNYTLEQIAKIAKDPLAFVTLNKRIVNTETAQERWSTIDVLAVIALENLSLPFDQRSSGWKRIFLTRETNQQFSTEQVKVDLNSLSDPELIELGFTRIAPLNDAPKAVELVSVNQNFPRTNEEMFEHLKSQGLIHGKVKLKGEAEVAPSIIDENEINPLTQTTENETGETA